MSPKLRKGIYIAVAVIGLVLGAVQVGVAEALHYTPAWLAVIMAVWTYLAGGAGIIATLHTLDGELSGKVEVNTDQVQVNVDEVQTTEADPEPVGSTSIGQGL